jgi:RimJ/RimL family protein N-acetyltransferase
MSFSSKPIEWEAHQTWLESRLGESRSRIYVGLQDSEPVGQIRFEITNDVDAEVHVYTKPGLQGMGIGSQLIIQGLQRLRQSSTVKTVHAMIKPENARSLRAFRRAGFVAADRQGVRPTECVHLIRTLP